MGERLLCKQEVIGSIPFTSTTGATPLPRGDRCSGAALRATGEPRVRRAAGVAQQRRKRAATQ